MAFVLAPQFTLLAFSAFVATLRLAADEGDRSRPIRCSWSVLSHNMRPVRSSCGVAVVPTAELDDPRKHDYVVVVGGTFCVRQMVLQHEGQLERTHMPTQ